MKLPDINVWLALALSGHTHHRAAKAWLEGEDGLAGLHFCRATQQGLVRLLTTEAVLAPFGNPPLTNREAWHVYEQFAKDDRIAFAAEPAGVEAKWKSLARKTTCSPKLWMDAWLAAFAITSGWQLVTLDRGFQSFEAQGLDLLLLKPLPTSPAP